MSLEVVSPLDILRHTTETKACLQGEGMPLLLHGLLQHETKLSVLNFSIRKASSHTGSIPNKAELLFCSGLRCIATLPPTAARDFAAATLARILPSLSHAAIIDLLFHPALPCFTHRCMSYTSSSNLLTTGHTSWLPRCQGPIQCMPQQGPSLLVAGHSLHAPSCRQTSRRQTNTSWSATCMMGGRQAVVLTMWLPLLRTYLAAANLLCFFLGLTFEKLPCATLWLSL